MLPVLVPRGAEISTWVVKGSGQVVQRPRLEGPGYSCRFCVFQYFPDLWAGTGAGLGRKHLC